MSRNRRTARTGLSEMATPSASSTGTPSSAATSKLLSVAVLTVIVPSLFATVALPAYAYSPVESSGAVASEQLQQLKTANAQSVAVSEQVPATSITRDAFSATSAAEIQQAAAEAERAALAAAYAAYSGPTAADYLANPPYPSFSLEQVAQVALQYQGVPYRFGGADPSGFDCSGLIMFVYAQFGIALPHGVSSQAALGTPIAREAAVPGDIVTMPGHNGIYLGNGTFIDAPDVGGVVSVRPIWTDDYYIYRLGI